MRGHRRSDVCWLAPRSCGQIAFAGKMTGQAERGHAHPRSTPLPPLAAIICKQDSVASRYQ